MAIFKRDKALPPSATVASDAVEQNAQIVERATGDNDRVAESLQNDEKTDVIDEKEKKKPTATIGNYFVSSASSKTLGHHS